MAENKMFNDKMTTTLFKKEIREDENTITIWANRSDVVDRSGHVIDDEAWQLDRFLANPVICAFHQYDRPPVAKALWARVVPGKGLMMKIKFASTQEGSEFYQLYSENVLNAFSVGFSGKKYVEAEDMTDVELKKYVREGVTPSVVFKEVELYEVSCVAVPDNFASLVAKSMKSEFKSKSVMDFLDEVKKAPEYIELISEPTEGKAKVIGHINLEQKCEHCQTADESTEEKSESTEDAVGKAEMPCDGEDGSCDGEKCPQHEGCDKPMKKSEMPCDGEDGSCDGEKCPQHEGCDKPMKKSLDVQDEVIEESIVGNQEDNTEEKSNIVVELKLDDQFMIILEEIKSIRAYVDEKIEKTLKFPEENADKVYTEKVEEKDVIDFEIRKETIELDFTPEDVKKMVIESVLSAKSKTQSVSDLVEERIKKAKGIIF